MKEPKSEAATQAAFAFLENLYSDHHLHRPLLTSLLRGITALRHPRRFLYFRWMRLLSAGEKVSGSPTAITMGDR
ncbi:MAG: hypothetical protein JOY96_04065 [Verrucomicrobia bacterium]|nr:hypothetical protein [Verrucomicrobiota bacterium]